MLLGAMANAAAIVVGGLIGLLFHRFIPERYSTLIMQGLSLCTIFMGIQMAFETANILVLIVCISVGAVLGELLRLEHRFEQLGTLARHALKRDAGESARFSNGFVTASMLFCIGPMAILGALQAGAGEGNAVYFSKAAIDGIAGMAYAAALGPGVLLSGACVLAYEGLLTLLSGWLMPLLSDPVVTEMGAMGGVLLIGMGLRILEIKNIRVANLLPAAFLPIAVVPLFALFG